jgi:adenosylmethionine-8-amino-7-oxononanoate aminotransferase
MIADEVMCGSGRSGTWRALEHDGVTPHIMCIAKGLAGGYVPLGATLVSSSVAAPIHAGNGVYQTGHTFSGHTTACAAALAVQTIIEREGLLVRVRERGAALQSQLRSALSKFDEVGDVRGRGYFIGVEFVLDIASRAFGDGLIVYPCAGNVNGTDGDTLIIAPPYNALDIELDELTAKLAKAVSGALASGTK